MITFEYDAKGNLIKDFDEYGSNTDATLNTFYRKTYTYNAFGKQLSSTQDYDQNAGGDFRRNIYDTTYLNDRVFPTIFMEKEDYTGDGTFDDFGKTTNTYDENNLLTSSLNQSTDENGNPVSTSSRYVYQYNDQQQVTRQDYENSFSGDTAQSITRNDYTYVGNTITDTETYISLNAPLGSNSNKEVFVETLNDAGHITKKTKAEYINDTLDAYGEVDYTSDSNERITQCLYSIDNTGDEQFNYATKKLQGYDANGVTSISYQTDYDNDGVFADDETYAASYGSQGELLSEDSDNRLFSYSGTTNDGVRYLVHEYLDITREVLRNSSICHLDVSSAK
ncbi:MAG: hypothetical protein HWE18_13280 [Gammaproteobacteria bacterium]|nr:hypothetical protein [Gammaproteobacteria bacterium]